MSSIPDYDRGFRDGVRASVTYLLNRSEDMNDPHAKIILNCMAFQLGVSRKLGRVTRNIKRPRHPKGYGNVRGYQRGSMT